MSHESNTSLVIEEILDDIENIDLVDLKAALTKNYKGAIYQAIHGEEQYENKEEE